MSDKIAIKVDNVSKNFKLPHEKNNSIKNAVVSFYKRKKSYEKQQVLKDVSFEIKDGEFFGIVGRNGSGKSTLLKMLAGIYDPNQGSIQVNGKLTPFIELGVGFNPELTGRENVFLNGALLGFSRTEMAAMYDDIVAFAELERFMDQKLKNYSSGMQVRLAFSIAIRAESDILLIDEVLAVGDAIFQNKCYDYFKELKKKKKTVVFVSHDTGALQNFCDRGILINEGKLVGQGDINDIVNDYTDLLNAAEEKQKTQLSKSEDGTGAKRWGTGAVQVAAIQVLDAKSRKERQVFTDTEANLTVTVTYKASKDTDKPVYGIIIFDGAGERIFQSNTMWKSHKTTDIREGEKVIVEWTVPNVFNTGTFTISPAVADQRGSTILDWKDEAARFKVRKSQKTSGFINVEHEITTLTK